MLTEAVSAIRFSRVECGATCRLYRGKGNAGIQSLWPSLLEIEELAAVFFVRNLTGLVFSEELISVARDQIVDFVSNPARQMFHNGGESAPDSAHFREYLNPSIGAGGQTFVGLRIVQQQIHRIQKRRVDSVPAEDVASKLTL